ncbi:MAG TPA: protein-(glutamine-N5) methyltransferase, release factor-specific, partial [Dehalococcoidia bacterium]|nr:protein-(glutamine-N5) methyltransferase, release factor-specific [Dehalococcoidia bacterium]
MSSLRAAVVAARDRLDAAGIDDPQIEAELLLRYALEVISPDQGRISRTSLYTRWQEALTAPVEAVFAAFLARRLSHEPTAYILGRREFWGLELRVTPAVLIPRPETEGLVTAVLREVRSAVNHGTLRVADIGTGSGAIAIALATELPAI